MQKPQLSIVIPTHNERDNMNPLIDHLLSAAGKDSVEIIVVDSLDSSDGTLEVIASDVVIKVPSSYASRAAQMHEGARFATADILYFLHADTRPTHLYVGLITDAIKNGFDFGLFSYRFDSDSRLLRVNSRFTKQGGIFTGGGDQGLFIRKSIYESHNGFDTNLPIMEDFEFYWRLKEAGLKYMIIPEDTIVSARKYAHNSYLKVQLVNLCTLLGFKWGRNPTKLRKFYSRMLG